MRTRVDYQSKENTMMLISSYPMKEPVITPMIKVVYEAVKRELSERGFSSVGRLVYAARYAYCEERLWRRVSQSEREFAEGKGIRLNSVKDLWS